MTQENYVKNIGWFASLTAIIMFSSYIDQIRLNIEGSPGSIILPIATTINCSAWVCYALLGKHKDWPLFSCNALGILAGTTTTITAII